MGSVLKQLAGLWTVTVIVLAVLAIFLATARHQDSVSRIDGHIEVFLAYSRTADGLTAGEVVRGFVSARIPATDELVVGVVDDAVVHLPRPAHAAGPGTDGVDLLAGATEVAAVPRKSVTVEDASGDTARLVVGVDTRPARARDTTLVAAAAAALATQAAAGSLMIMLHPRQHQTRRHPTQQRPPGAVEPNEKAHEKTPVPRRALAQVVLSPPERTGPGAS